MYTDIYVYESEKERRQKMHKGCGMRGEDRNKNNDEQNE